MENADERPNVERPIRSYIVRILVHVGDRRDAPGKQHSAGHGMASGARRVRFQKRAMALVAHHQSAVGIAVAFAHAQRPVVSADQFNRGFQESFEHDL